MLWVLFERFTERARQVVVLAQEEARALSHNYIGTEHILLGLAREEEGLAARVLKSLDITVERLRAEVVRLVASNDQAKARMIPFTAEAKRALEGALHEALVLGHEYVATGHILLGLVRETDDVTASILAALGTDADKIRDETIRMLSGTKSQRAGVGQQLGYVNPRVSERLTERARQVVVLAQEEARALKHNYIGTEHILLGLLREAEGLAARVLESLDVTFERARAQVLRIVGSGDEVTSGQIPFTPRTKVVLEQALREAQNLGHNYLGTEHMLLGLARENEGVAARILLGFDADADKIRNETIRTLLRPRSPTPGVVPVDSAWFGRLAGFLGCLTADVRRELGREPDTGDLLLALGSAADTTAGRSLRELGIDLDELQSTIERTRAQKLATDEDRTEEVRQEKERAIESNQPKIAARLRDEERRLTKASRQNQQTLLSEIRRRFGLPAPPGAPNRPPADQ